MVGAVKVPPAYRPGNGKKNKQWTGRLPFPWPLYSEKKLLTNRPRSKRNCFRRQVPLWGTVGRSNRPTAGPCGPGPSVRELGRRSARRAGTNGVRARSPFRGKCRINSLIPKQARAVKRHLRHRGGLRPPRKHSLPEKKKTRRRRSSRIVQSAQKNRGGPHVDHPLPYERASPLLARNSNPGCAGAKNKGMRGWSTDYTARPHLSRRRRKAHGWQEDLVGKSARHENCTFYLRLELKKPGPRPIFASS